MVISNRSCMYDPPSLGCILLAARDKVTAFLFKSLELVLRQRIMNAKHNSQSIAFMIILTFTYESQCQSTVDLSSNPCENDSRLRSLNGGMLQVEDNSLRDMVAKLVTEVNEQRTQLNVLRQMNNCSQNERMADQEKKLIELKEVFVESRFHTERDNLAIRRQLNEMKELVESMQQWNMTLVETLNKLEQENGEQNAQLLHLRQENESLRTNNTEQQEHQEHQQLSETNNMQEQLILVNSSLHERTDELRSLLSEHAEQLRLVQQQNAVHEEQLTLLLQLNSSLMATVAWQQEMKASLNEINRTTEDRIAALEEENRNHEEQLRQTNDSLSMELVQLKEQNSQQQRQQLANAENQPNNTAVAYIRWGRKVCPTNSTVIYKGYAAGSRHSEKGGGSNYLCLPERPEWGQKIDGIQGMGSYVHGVEYELHQSNSPFLTTNNGGSHLHNVDAPCSLCQVEGRSTQIMVPARRDCPAGWYLQYRGYLVTSHMSHHKKDYICLDEAPEAIHGSHRSDDPALLYPVEAVCGSLPCPHYVNGWEIACVVCVR